VPVGRNYDECWDCGDNVYLTQDDNVNRSVYIDATVNYDYTAALYWATIDATGSGTMTVVQDSGNFFASYPNIGYNGKGIYVQTGGFNLADGLFLGVNEGSTGTYNLSGNGILHVLHVVSVGGSLLDGPKGTGIFNQSDDSLYYGDAVRIWPNGTYNLSGNAVSGPNVWLTVEPGGIFNQSGGTLGQVNVDFTLLTLHGTYNLSGGTSRFPDVYSQIFSDKTFNYSGGSVSFGGLTNDGTVTLSGSGIRTIDTSSGGITNNRTFKATNTTAVYTAPFINNGAFVSDSSVNIFADLIIGENGYMVGDWEDLWFVGGELLGVNINGNSVTNIYGAEGMYVYYIPTVPGNAYLQWLTYDLSGGGKLLPRSSVPNLTDIDVKPNTYPNDVNLKQKGVIPVAILTTADFDALSVNPSTVVLQGQEPVHWAAQDVDNDGNVDLIFQFDATTLPLTQESTTVVLTGKTIDGIDILGMDTVNIVAKKQKEKE
jgi:hypothetical protein